MTIKEATKFLDGIVKNIEKQSYFARKEMKQLDDLSPLTLDEATVLNLYTREWSDGLYQSLNRILRTRKRENIKPYFPILKLMLTAIEKLPKFDGTVNRGVKLSIGDYYRKGKSVVWWGFSSCTTSVEVLGNDMFLGAGGNRTLFQIKVQSGVDIKKYSNIKNEDEILLPLASQLKVDASVDLGNGLVLIQMTQKTPKHFSLIE